MEILSFSSGSLYLCKRAIKDKRELIKTLKEISVNQNLPLNRIVFNHDFEDTDYKGELRKVWLNVKEEMKGGLNGT